MIEIKNASQEDLSLLCQFNQAMAIETEDKPLSDGTLNTGISKVLQDPDLGFYLIAVKDGTTAGALMVTNEWSDWRNGLFWWIQSVYVLPEYRRQGVFNALYQKVKELALANKNICGIRLYVERENINAQQTYEAMGMGETHYRIFEEEFKPGQES